MFELIFGGFFTIMSLIFTIVALGICLFGDEPFFFFGLLFLIPFWTIGIIFLKQGIVKIKRDNNTKKLGRDSFALVMEFTDSGCYVNGYPIWNAHLLVMTDYGVEEFVESVGTNPQFDIGDIVSVKYHNRDVNVGAKVHESMLPEGIKQQLMDAAPFGLKQKIEEYKIQNQDFIVSGEYIIIDGVKYERPQ